MTGLVWVSGPGLEVVYLNRAAAEAFRALPTASPGRSCFDLVRACDADGRAFCGAHCPVRSAARLGRTLPPVDVRVRIHEGERWYRWFVVPIAAPDGGEWIVHCAHDVERERRIEDYVRRVARRSECLRRPEHGHAPEPLSPREREILDLLADDQDSPAIARRLGIRHVTVRNHVQRLMGKLGAHSVQEAVALHLLSV